MFFIHFQNVIVCKFTFLQTMQFVCSLLKWSSFIADKQMIKTEYKP